MDVIRCDEPTYLIWKWHPKGAIPGKNKRENFVRWGSALRVREGSVAIFIYSGADGYAQDIISGPCDMILNTGNLPVLTSLFGAVYDGGSPFQAEVYFINLAKLIQIKFGVPFFDVFDPRFLDFGVPVAVRGTISFSITDFREFIKLHRLDNFDLQTFQMQIRDAVIKTIKNIVANAPMEYDIPVIQLEQKLSLINKLAEEDLKKQLYENFGITISGVDIASIELDKDSEGYQQLKKVTQDVSAAMIQAQTEVNIKKMQDTQQIEARHLEGTLKAQREEAQYEQRIRTQAEHLTVHQINQQAAVNIAGAEALGQMGGNGGVNSLVMMSMAGGAICRSMMGVMDGVAGSLNHPITDMKSSHVPAIVYYVAFNGQSTGPFDLDMLSQMIKKDTLLKSSLIWKPGMVNWVQAGEVPELQELFLQKSSMSPEIKESFKLSGKNH